MRVKIEKLVYGGDGLARTGDGVIFVPRTAPGDVVEVEVQGIGVLHNHVEDEPL